MGTKKIPYVKIVKGVWQNKRRWIEMIMTLLLPRSLLGHLFLPFLNLFFSQYPPNLLKATRFIEWNLKHFTRKFIIVPALKDCCFVLAMPCPVSCKIKLYNYKQLDPINATKFSLFIIDYNTKLHEKSCDTSTK